MILHGPFFEHQKSFKTGHIKSASGFQILHDIGSLGQVSCCTRIGPCLIYLGIITSKENGFLHNGLADVRCGLLPAVRDMRLFRTRPVVCCFSRSPQCSAWRCLPA